MATEEKTQTLGQKLSEWWNDGRKPVEAVLRHWRGQYREMGTRELSKLGQDRDARVEEVKEQCIARCRSALVEEGVTLEAADQWCRRIALPPGSFQGCIEDLKLKGIAMASKEPVAAGSC